MIKVKCFIYLTFFRLFSLIIIDNEKMLCNSSDSNDFGGNGSNLNEVNETDLVEMLKSYYRIARQALEKEALIKDPALVHLIVSLLTDQRQSISVYICKILLALTERPEDAKALAENKELKSQLNNAFSVDNEAAIVPPRVLRKLLVVQTRLSKASNTPEKQPRKTIFGASAQNAKQLVFEFDRTSDAERRQMEQKCIAISGVVSICFQQHGPNETRCLIRCRDNVEDKELIRAILSTGGLDMVKQLVRGCDGQTETFEFYASQLEQEEQFLNVMKETQLPKYLDDDQLFDPAQCLATKEQVEASQGGGWMSSLKSFFW